MIHSLRAGDAPVAGTEIATITRMGEPDGRAGRISLADRYVTREGKPWFPVMGEYHFSRNAAERWETELLKMKAGGDTVFDQFGYGREWDLRAPDGAAQPTSTVIQAFPSVPDSAPFVDPGDRPSSDRPELSIRSRAHPHARPHGRAVAAPIAALRLSDSLTA